MLERSRNGRGEVGAAVDIGQGDDLQCLSYPDALPASVMHAHTILRDEIAQQIQVVTEQPRNEEFMLRRLARLLAHYLGQLLILQ